MDKTTKFLKWYTGIILFLALMILLVDWIVNQDGIDFLAILIWSPVAVYFYRVSEIGYDKEELDSSIEKLLNDIDKKHD